MSLLELILITMAVVLYLSLALLFGLGSLGRGHRVMFVLGFAVPLFWVAGTFIPGPKDM